MNTTIEQLYQYYLQHPKVSTDSRKVEAGDLFFGLSGATFDGNQFAAAALAKGASYAVIDNPAYQKDQRYLLVENTLTALQELATHHRKQLNIACIAITGTNGKTTTKELVKAVLSQSYRTYGTAGNFNNHIGVPLTLLSLPQDTEMAVIEMGANHLHEIHELCLIARPNFGLITNIGKAHLEGFGSVDGVMQTKGELFVFLEGVEGRAFVNLNDERVAKIAYFQSKASTYGTNRWATNMVTVESLNPYLKVHWQPKRPSKKAPLPEAILIQTQLIGKYNSDNVAAAITVGHHFKVPAEKIKTAIESYVPKNNRSQIVQQNGNTIILDAYNANPSSMWAALDNLEALEASQKGVILGDMLELGEDSLMEHQKIIDRLQQMSHLQAIALVGKEFKRALHTQQQPTIQHFPEVSSAKKWYQQQQFSNMHWLIKGSRGIALEKIILGL